MYRMDKQRAAPKKLYALSKEAVFVITENLMLLKEKNNVTGNRDLYKTK